MAAMLEAWLVDTRTRGMAMGLFLITFDLKDAPESSYERIYEWAHRVGGYRYFRFENGMWGRLPSTTIVVPLDAVTNVAARDKFQTLLEGANYTPTHIAVADGNTRAVLSNTLHDWQVPDYAKQRVSAGV
jgi:hypothetical protein